MIPQIEVEWQCLCDACTMSANSVRSANSEKVAGGVAGKITFDRSCSERHGYIAFKLKENSSSVNIWKCG